MLAYCIRKSLQDATCRIDSIACEIDVSNCPLHDLGGGYRGYLVEAPWPGVGSCIVDSRTGAILGGTLVYVKNFIRDCNLRDDEGRQRTAIRLRRAAKRVPPDEFWPWIIQVFAGKPA